MASYDVEITNAFLVYPQTVERKHGLKGLKMASSAFLTKLSFEYILRMKEKYVWLPQQCPRLCDPVRSKITLLAIANINYSIPLPYS